MLELISGNYPFVLAGRYNMALPVPLVTVDNLGGAKAATNHLLDLGYRDIGHVGGLLSYYPGQERLRGFREAMAERGVPIREEWVLELESAAPAAAERAARQLLESPSRPRALFVYSGIAALTVLRTARVLGIKVPEELAVVGFDDSIFAEIIDPPLTTVRQPSYEMGREATQMLLRLIGGEAGAIQRKILPTELVVRRSCGAPPGRADGAGITNESDWL